MEQGEEDARDGPPLFCSWCCPLVQRGWWGRSSQRLGHSGAVESILDLSAVFVVSVKDGALSVYRIRIIGPGTPGESRLGLGS